MDFINKAKRDIDNLISSPKLVNFKNQAFAWKLNSRFKRTFDEQYLWSQALFLSTNSCLILHEDRLCQTAINGLSESAEIYESLSKLTDTQSTYDKEHFLFLSALCYDLAGYQANAYCIASSLSEYELATTDTDIDLAVDNLVISQILLILTRRIPLAASKLEQKIQFDDFGYNLFKTAMSKWYKYILKQDYSDYVADINKTYIYYLQKGNVYLSHFLFLLKERMSMIEDRGIWSILKKNEKIQNNYQWRKYVRLLSFDYYADNKIKIIEDRKSIFEFWTSQLRALERNVINSNENYVVQMPTSTGKTFISELMILRYLIEYPDKKCLYVAPFRALNNEKEIELGRYLSKLGFSVSSLSGTYEIDDFQDVVLTETDLLIATPEKMDSLLRFQSEIFTNVSFIVIDEGHIIGDISTRATLLEFLLIRLRMKIPELKTLFISAVMPSKNADEYSIWLNGNGGNVLRSLRFPNSDISDEWEPTRKLISCFEWIEYNENTTNGNITFKNVEIFNSEKNTQKRGAILNSFLKEKEFGDRFPNKSKKKETTASLAYKLSEEGATLVFCGTVYHSVDSVANSMLDLLKLIDIPERFRIKTNKKSSFYAEKWYGNASYITDSINHGIGIHFGDMPEQVRMAVEEDFREGFLCVLLATNTVGQGLNFPIKNIIFHKIQLDERKYIQHRDFWNIVGRAGRAGKETEGKIIFVIRTPNDRRLYKKFIDKNNIEPAESLIFKALSLLQQRRLSKEVFSDNISLLSEPYLLDLLTEEIIGTEYEEIIENIIKNSLFKVQIDKNELDLEPLKTEFKRIFKSFEQNTTPEQLMVYKMTGLSFKSNKTIEDFIHQNITDLKNYIDQDDYLKIVEFYLVMLSENDIPEMNNKGLNKLRLQPIRCFPVIDNWINGMSLNDIFDIWQETTNLEIGKLHIFIANALYYLYPWGISSFLIILSYKTENEFKNLPENIKNISSYLKYGLNKQTSCLARSLGIKSREASKCLQESSNELQGKDFIRWVANLGNNEINNFKLSNYDKDNIREVVLRLVPNKNHAMGNEYIFTLKGTNYNNDWMKNSKNVYINENLEYVREYDNEYDPYAIIIKKDSLGIGYIPRDISRFISSEIDISDKKYIVNVIEILNKNDYNEIKVKMKEEYIFNDFVTGAPE
jgi:superfamily II DNA/RNA helicase